ncbi:TIM barrel protein [Thermogemmatispora tikiterensis]|uniref:Xylose isomerase n=1 Tax=Thermogemmatispora tikiterensis TaxID=1825093 RepID=A0A328VDN2_9CHLR|nr:TIM barrel protein [Thermogemmatispora tikiterensis]RAQ95858.1 xylose isomerase [Thermogemmatispora tikiterensis]
MTKRTIRVGNAPCSWGVIENVAGDRSAYTRVLDEMRQAGYEGTELGDWGFLPPEPSRLRTELAARQLELIGAWVSVSLHDPQFHSASEAAALRTARLVAEVGGASALIVLGDNPYSDPVRTREAGRIGREQGLSEEQWNIFVAGANRVARAVLEATGLRCVFHPHIGTWIETPEETERLLSLTDPTCLGLCLDTGHIRFGGGDPLVSLRHYHDRVWLVHFKDHDPRVAEQSRRLQWNALESIAHGIFCELGQGDIDFPAIVQQLQEHSYCGWIVVEQDILPGMGSPFESARRNREYLRALGL